MSLIVISPVKLTKYHGNKQQCQVLIFVLESEGKNKMEIRI
jgi:hypothetical protein